LTTCVFVGALASVALFSNVASAATIEAKLIDVSPSQTLDYNFDGANKSTTAGTFNWLRTGGDWPHVPAVNSNFVTFCIELIQSIQGGVTYTYTVADLEDAPIPDNAPLSGPMGVTKADYIMELWSDQVILGGGNLSNADFAAAMQTSIWEIVYDDGLDLGSGTFQTVTTGGFVDDAQGFLDELDGSTLLVTMKAMTSITAQDHTFLTVIPTIDIPAPMAFGMGLVGLGLIGRRR